MIPGLPQLPSGQLLSSPLLPSHGLLPGSAGLLPMLHQAWLSRAATHTANSFVNSSAFLPHPHPPVSSHAGFPGFNPFLPLAPPSTSPDLDLKVRAREEAEDLSSAKRMRTEIICPICSIAVRREDILEHFETELKCLDNIRSLSPISRPYSTSPTNQSTSLSPSSPGYLENRWQRFERIRSKRRERIGVKGERRMVSSLRNNNEFTTARGNNDEDIDIGDSLSDSGSISDSESNQNSVNPAQYTEADVLRSLNSEDSTVGTVDNEPTERTGMKCGACGCGMVRPVLNVSCWHLKCEQCWLRAAGTSKVCSICNHTASVKDLRRVHV